MFKDIFALFANRRGEGPNATPKAALSVKERFAALKNLPAFLKIIWETSPSMALGNIGLRLLRSVIPLSLLYIGKLIIDEAIHPTQIDGVADFGRLYTLIGIEFGLAIFSDILARGVSLFDSLLGDKFSNESSISIMKHASALDLNQFEDANFYDKLERARRQTIGRTALMSQVLAQAQDAVTMIFLAGGLISFNPWLIVLLLVAVIPAFLGESHFNEQSYSLTRSWTPERRELDYLRLTGASDETAKEVKIFGLSDFLIERFRFLSDKFYVANKKIAIQRAGWGTFFAALGSVGYYGAYIFIVLQTAQGVLSVGSMTFLAGSFMRLRGLFEAVLQRFGAIADGALYLADYFEFFNLQPKIKSKAGSLPFPRPIKVGFTFENVTFQYQNAATASIANLSFTLKAGEKLALVGENGAGKTTLVKLLSRLYDPTEGRILLDGIDLKEYDIDDLRIETGVIFQDFVKFQLSAGQNIAVGNIAEQDNQPIIAHAASMSLADTVIDKLPEGYNQIIGKRFAKGVDLSGGQWQKIALGRAYMREAQLLILDEPTAALDARAEYEVFERFADLTKGKTAVLISHRFSTVRMADRVLVLENGRFVEMGSHEELMAANGKYAGLFNLQAQGYK